MEAPGQILQGGAPAAAAAVVPVTGTAAPAPAPVTGTAAAIQTIPGVGAPAPAAPTLFKEGVKFSDNWRKDFLPEDLRDEPSLLDYTDLHGLVKSAVHLKKMVGKDKIALPTDSSDTDGWNAFHKAGGRPDTPGDYQLKAPEGFELDKARLSEYQEIFFKGGASEGLANSIIEKYAQEHMDQEKADNDTKQLEFIAAEQELRSEYGMAFDDRVKVAESVLGKYDPDGAFKEMNLLNNPKMIRALVKIGNDLKSTLSEDTLGQSFKGPMSPDEIQSKIDAMAADKKGPLMNEMHPQHQSAIVTYKNLVAQKSIAGQR